MEYATIWKDVIGYRVEWRKTPDVSQQPVPTAAHSFGSKIAARNAVKASGAKLWN